MIWVVFTGNLIFCLLSYKAYHNDISAPTTLMFIFSVVSNIATFFWCRITGVILERNVVYILLLGSSSVFMGGLLALINNKIDVEKSHKESVIYISNQIYFILTVYSIVILLMEYYGMKNALYGIGKSFDHIGQLISTYRYYYIRDRIDLPLMIRAFARAQKMLVYCMIYVFVKNSVIDRSFFKHRRAIYIIAIYVLSTLMQGSRTDFVLVFLSLIIMYSLFYQRINGRITYKNIGVLMKMCWVILIALCTFVFIKSAVGRTTPWSDLEYVAYYLGTGPCSLQRLLLTSLEPAYAAFPSTTLYNFLGSIAIYFPVEMPKQVGFTYYNGISLGNTYTAFRQFYYDYGYWGVVLFSVISSFIISRLYMDLRYRNVNPYKCIWYVYFAASFIMMYYDELVYSKISQGILIESCALIIWVKIVFHNRIKLVWKRTMVC